MPWLAFALLAANVVLAVYLLLAAPPAPVQPDVRALEVNADRVKIAEPGASKPAPQARAPAATAACLEWSAFDRADLGRVQADLAGLGAARTFVRDLGPTPAWWVHIPPLRSREEAQRRALEIEAAGVTDVRVVAENERWRNAVSLGIYKTEETAAARVARLREAGVANAAVARRDDLLRTAAIVIVEPTQALAARIAELRSAYPGTQLQAIACPAEAA